ncbi:hypothetical protein [Rhodopirellula sp. MGV]|uniref:hypothetical protein n=1 Tax=Rhodopirellula sp. MGV TaxID=2023130 RepID=UPI000B976652|nr:hypothetical protein [Rhodopirellula sp. MGV]OYP34909.1 hypothetical protein CGZ80_12815 [Rhodopirellula sp. MGV]PNY38194.1 hypothetical protein C2E31_04135 [Rhodopirellula baltica]
MNPTIGHDVGGVAFEAQLETWQTVRADIKHQIAKITTLAVVYLLASLAIGGLLLSKMLELSDGFLFVVGWRQYTPVEMGWLHSVLLGYLAAGLGVALLFVLVQAIVWNWLPSGLFDLVAMIPWVGSTVRAIALGEFFQSIYKSVSLDQTYARAFESAAEQIRNSSLRRWARIAAGRIESGQSLESLISTIPIHDQPVCVLGVLISQHPNQVQTLQLWHHATEECHRLAESRLYRTRLFIHVTCLLTSVFIAGLALFFTVGYAIVMIRGLSY